MDNQEHNYLGNLYWIIQKDLYILKYHHLKIIWDDKDAELLDFSFKQNGRWIKFSIL